MQISILIYFNCGACVFPATTVASTTSMHVWKLAIATCYKLWRTMANDYILTDLDLNIQNISDESSESKIYRSAICVHAKTTNSLKQANHFAKHVAERNYQAQKKIL